MLLGSPLLQLAVFIHILQLAVYNVVGMFVTGELGAVGRTVVESLRTLVVWMADLALYYILTHGQLGEAWVWPWSAVQAVGFGCLVAGTLLYSAGDKAQLEALALEAGIHPAQAFPGIANARATKPMRTLRATALQVIALRRMEHLVERMRAAGMAAAAVAAMQHDAQRHHERGEQRDEQRGEP